MPLRKGAFSPRALAQRIRRTQNNLRFWRLARACTQAACTQAACAQAAPQAIEARPIVFFNASTRLTGASLNAAFAFLTSAALRLQGIPVVHFVCQAGMSQCILSASQAFEASNGAPPAELPAPPCRACQAQSGWLHTEAPVTGFDYQPDPALRAALAPLTLAELADFTWPAADGRPAPLGALVLPGLRWVLRRHHLADDPLTRRLYADFILSADNVLRQFSALLDRTNPQTVVVFNGSFFPEATARWAAMQRGIRVISHEVGLRPFSAFFTPGEATAYPLEIPADFALTPIQEARLDEYLSQRFQGNFSMAGVQFWPSIQPLDPAFVERAAAYPGGVAPIFTNVIFDTSQPHSNVLFPHMFAWLDSLLPVIRAHPGTLFVLRAHPDEHRPGKASRESVGEWAIARDIAKLPNLLFVPAQQFISSYQLIRMARFVLIYNSTIGLEAAILGAAVLAAGRSRFTQNPGLPCVFFPTGQAAYHQQLEQFLVAKPAAPPDHRRNARNFLYYQLYKSSLPFGDFLEADGIWPGFVRLQKLAWQQLLPEHSAAMRVILAGLTDPSQPFLLPDDALE